MTWDTYWPTCTCRRAHQAHDRPTESGACSSYTPDAPYLHPYAEHVVLERRAREIVASGPKDSARPAKELLAVARAQALDEHLGDLAAEGLPASALPAKIAAELAALPRLYDLRATLYPDAAPAAPRRRAVPSVERGRSSEDEAERRAIAEESAA